MPSTSKAQQRLFGMALAVRKHELKRSDVHKSVLDIVDSDMTNKEIEDFAKTKQKGLPEKKNEAMNYTSLSSFINESLGIEIKYANGFKYKENTFNIERFPTCFIIIKPGFSRLAGTIIEMFKKNGFTLKKQCTKRLTLSEAQRLYRPHAKKKFYNVLCRYMASDVSIGILFEKNTDIATILNECTELKKKIRTKYQESELRNVIHSSDSLKRLKDEARIYFESM